MWWRLLLRVRDTLLVLYLEFVGAGRIPGVILKLKWIWFWFGLNFRLKLGFRGYSRMKRLVLRVVSFYYNILGTFSRSDNWIFKFSSFSRISCFFLSNSGCSWFIIIDKSFPSSPDFVTVKFIIDISDEEKGFSSIDEFLVHK